MKPRQLSPKEFEGFYRSQADEVNRTLSVVLRDPDLASEAVDEAMTRAFERWRTVRRYDNPTGWVYRVALNWSRSRLRKSAEKRRSTERRRPGRTRYLIRRWIERSRDCRFITVK